jgi:hypothetical protein
MSLPKILAGTDSVDVGGELFDLRSLTRGEAMQFHRMVSKDKVDTEDLEMAVIAAATDTPLDEVRDWYRATPAWAVEELVGHIQRLSRIEPPSVETAADSEPA